MGVSLCCGICEGCYAGLWVGGESDGSKVGGGLGFLDSAALHRGYALVLCAVVLSPLPQRERGLVGGRTHHRNTQLAVDDTHIAHGQAGDALLHGVAF